MDRGSYRPVADRKIWICEPNRARFRQRFFATVSSIVPCWTGVRASAYTVLIRVAQGLRPASDFAIGSEGVRTLPLRAEVRHPEILPLDRLRDSEKSDRPRYKYRRTLDLVGRIIDGSDGQEEVIQYHPADTLLMRFEKRRGLPIGNQTSLFFANVYFNPLDHFVLRELWLRLYLRYVDDFVLFRDDKKDLGHMAEWSVSRVPAGTAAESS
jgi:hypothetical protein